MSTPPPALSPQALLESGAVVAELTRELQTSTEPARHIEIIYEIALQPAPSAIDALRKIHAGTDDAEKREHVTRSLALAAPANLDAALTFLRDLLAPSQPTEARTVAAETLRDIEAPAALPIWREVTHDADPDLQETARAAVEYLTGLYPGR